MDQYSKEDNAAVRWGREMWIFTLIPGVEGGRIQIYQGRSLYISLYTSPSKFMAESVERSIDVYGEHTVNLRFDLLIEGAMLDSSKYPRLIDSIRNMQSIGNLNKVIDLGELPVSLYDIWTVNERLQACSGRGLRRIYAAGCQSFTIEKFRHFASVTGATLTRLELGDVVEDLEPSLVTIVQLPALLEAVEENMPNLTHLSLAISHWEDAESIYGNNVANRGTRWPLDRTSAVQGDAGGYPILQYGSISGAFLLSRSESIYRSRDWP